MKREKFPFIVVFAALTVVTVFFWIIFSVVRIITKPEDVGVEPAIIEPLEPSLNTEILSDLKSRVFLGDNEITETVIASTAPLATPEATEEPATSSAVLTTPEATASATVSPTPSPTP